MPSNIANRLTRLRPMLLLQLSIGLGILFNFAKEMQFAYIYGTNQEIEVFRIAFGIPYALFQSFGTILVGILMPIYLKRKELDAETFPTITAQTQLFLLIVFIVGIASYSLQADLLAPGYTGELRNKLEVEIALCWLFYLLVTQTFPIRLYLQSVNRTQLVASTSLIIALTTIGVVGLDIYLYHAPTKWLLIIASLISGAVVLGVYIYQGKKLGLPSMGLKYHRLTTYKKDPIYLALLLGFLMIFLNMSQRIIDRAFASTQTSGTVGSLEYAYNIYTALGLLIGTTAVLLLNKGIAQRFHTAPGTAEFKWLVRKIMPILVISSLIAALASLYSNELIALIYEHGHFNKADTAITSEIFFYLMWSFPFMVLSMILMQVMFAVDATKILILFALIKLTTKYLVINWTSNFEYGMYGLSNTGSEFLSCFLFFAFLTYKLNPMRSAPR
ncbi:MAG: lipid II flippase MurJ [Gallionella sp.]|nr:lipid II flippase MurJ [Gallionella sp.]